MRSVDEIGILFSGEDYSTDLNFRVLSVMGVVIA